MILKKVATELGAVTITSKKPLIVKRKIHRFLFCRSFFYSLFNRKNYTSDENFYAKHFNPFQERNFRLGVTLNFGKLTENVSKKKGVNNDDQVQ